MRNELTVPDEEGSMLKGGTESRSVAPIEPESPQWARIVLVNGHSTNVQEHVFRL